MTQENQSINSHIEEYLDYYCGLSHSPEFAVLLKGQWGAGKTWFINRYHEKLKQNNQKCLYISLYGMSSFSDIEEELFRQLHPVLSSKAMAITGKVLKGVLRGTLRIDLDSDGKDEGSWNPQNPDINIPDYLKNTNENILIFDDLERCNINIGNLLGYINYFVEHQGLKVILIANEDELIKSKNNYQTIKEKLIGKTFNVFPSFEGALENFITKIDNASAREFLSENVDLIKDLYNKAEYENLRNLKQIVSDFERIFEVLSEKAKSKSELLQDLLKLLMAFSIEIKRGAMLPKDIENLQEEYISTMSKQINFTQVSDSIAEGNNQEQTPLQKVLNRYTVLDLSNPFPSAIWWRTFFDKGIIDTQELEQSIPSSKYFQDENTPDWIKLWHFVDLSNSVFNDLLREVETKYSNRQFLELGVIKHIFGLLLTFSDGEIYNKTKKEILEDSKLYLDYLKDNNPSALIAPLTIEDAFGSYARLGFQGKDFGEFKEFLKYINQVQELVKNESMPGNAQMLLDIMQNSVQKFYSRICLSGGSDEDISAQKYHEVPILKYIEPPIFIEKILFIESFEHKQWVFWALEERYKFDGINKKLLEELEWLKSVRVLLLEEINGRKGELDGFILKRLVNHYLNGAIKKLELSNK